MHQAQLDIVIDGMLMMDIVACVLVASGRMVRVLGFSSGMRTVIRRLRTRALGPAFSSDRDCGGPGVTNPRISWIKLDALIYKGWLAKGLHVGGNWTNGSNAGFFIWNANNDPSNTNSNIGARLFFLFLLYHLRVVPHRLVKIEALRIA